jgi:hypothetical protein
VERALLEGGDRAVGRGLLGGHGRGSMRDRASVPPTSSLDRSFAMYDPSIGGDPRRTPSVDPQRRPS